MDEGVERKEGTEGDEHDDNPLSEALSVQVMNGDEKDGGVDEQMHEFVTRDVGHWCLGVAPDGEREKRENWPHDGVEQESVRWIHPETGDPKGGGDDGKACNDGKLGVADTAQGEGGEDHDTEDHSGDSAFQPFV